MSRRRPPDGFVPNIRPDPTEPTHAPAPAPAPPGSASAERLEELRRQLVAGDWRDPDMLVAAAELCLELGQRDEGRSMLARALRIDRNHARARELLTGMASAYEMAELGVEAPSHAFKADSKSLFLYPLRGDGIYVIIGGAVMFGALPFAFRLFAGGGPMGIPFLCLTLSLIFLASCYLLLLLRDVIYSSAAGEEGPPQWPEPQMDAMFSNFAWAVVLGSVAWLPAAVVHDTLFLLGAELAAEIAMLAAVIPGMYVFPMMFLYHVVTKNVLPAFRPGVILAGIRTASPGYRRAALVWQVAGVAMAGMIWLLGTDWGYLLGPVVVAACVYLLMLAGRALGLVFQAHKEKLDWLG